VVGKAVQEALTISHVEFFKAGTFVVLAVRFTVQSSYKRSSLGPEVVMEIS
jgi:hypothetical protein